MNSSELSLIKQQKKNATRRNDIFRRRRIAIIRRAEQLRADSDARVYIVVYRAGRYYTYMSHPTSVHWPPPASELVRMFHLEFCRILTHSSLTTSHSLT